MRHPKTTIGGVCLIVGSLATFIGRWIGQGLPSLDEWVLCITGLNAGVVAVLSADGSQVNKVEAKADTAIEEAKQ